MAAEHTLTNLLINTYFALSDTLDMLMKEIIYRMEVLERGNLKHEFKHQHHLLMDSAKSFRARYDIYADIFRIKCLKSGDDYDNARDDANTFMRLVLMFADRCDTNDKSKQVFELMSKMPMDVASNDYIGKFRLE